jgi:hypothetical protein
MARTRREDGEEGEDEGLDHADEHVEQLPGHREDDAGGEERDGKADQQGDHDSAREQIAEEPQRQGDRLGDLFDDVQGEHDNGLAEEVLDVAADALGLEGGPGRQDENQKGERVGEIDVCGWRRAVVGVVKEAGQDLQPVGDQDEHEEGHRQRDNTSVGGAEGVLDLVGDTPDHQFPGQLQLAGHTRSSPGSQVEAQTEDDGAGHCRGPDGVEVEGDSANLACDVLADRDVDCQDAGCVNHRCCPLGGSAGAGNAPGQ